MDAVKNSAAKDAAMENAEAASRRRSGKDAAREALRAEANREELAARLAQALPEDGKKEVMEGLGLRRYSAPGERLFAVSQPSLCVIAQGSKAVYLGERRFQYDPYHYLLVTAELPIGGQVIEASEKRPLLGLILTLDAALVSSVMVEAGHSAPQGGADVRALDVNPLGASLLDAAVRLVRLLDVPEEAPVLQPMITREIIYRLLQGEQSARLRQIAVLNGSSHRITRAIKRIQKHFDQSFRVEDLAEGLGMSESSFYQHFKSVTGLTPLQFQKQLQLQEARRLMLSRELDAATAGYEVGYNDASHFSREYKRLFGQPPVRDVERLRGAASESAV